MIGRASTRRSRSTDRKRSGEELHDRHLAQLQIGGEGCRVAPPQQPVEVEGVGPGVGRDLVGEADLIRLAGGQFGLAAEDVGEVLIATAPASEADLVGARSLAEGERGRRLGRVGDDLPHRRLRLVEPALGLRLVAVAERDHVRSSTHVVDGDEAVGEHHHCIGHVRPMHVWRAAVRL